jgi:GDP-L-fucose synthase
VQGEARFWSERRVLITGAHGFLGRALTEKITAIGPGELLTPERDALDFLDRRSIDAYLSETRPNIVIHTAAVVGGIGANRAEPARFFYENALMGIQTIDAAYRNGVKKFVCIGTTCAYPKMTPVPFSEDRLWDGYPEETNAPYGVAKRALLVQLQAYRRQYGFNGIFLVPANLYGPGDHFDVEKGHVIPAMIEKFSAAAAANDEEVVLWGDGTPTREFLFVDDAAEGIVLAASSYDDGDPVNLGTSEEVSIRDLANEIVSLTGYRGRIRWDASQPNGQPRRRLDVTRAAERFGFHARVPLRDGLRRTVAWYQEQRGRMQSTI